MSLEERVKAAVHAYARYGEGVRHIAHPEYFGASDPYLCGERLSGWTPTPFYAWQEFVEKAAPPMCEDCKEIAILRTLGDL